MSTAWLHELVVHLMHNLKIQPLIVAVKGDQDGEQFHLPWLVVSCDGEIFENI